MKGLSFSLSARGVYGQVLVAYSLMSILPILIILYLSFQYILPTIPMEERLAFTDPIVQAMIWSVVLFPLLGLYMVITMAKRIEKLAEAIRVMEEQIPEKPESKIVPDTQDEIGTLSKQFFEMRDIITKQMEQLNESNLKVLDANKRLQEMSIRDGLTTLFNRRHFDGRLEEEVQRARRYARKFALEMIDIDHFKRVNDTYGHTCGDEILKQIAQIMKENTRETDVICRYGGEEFSILLIETDEESAYDHAERLRETVAASPFTNGQDPLNEKVTISVGVAFFPQDGGDPQRLVESADGALYAAKRGGRNQVKRANELQKQEKQT